MSVAISINDQKVNVISTNPDLQSLVNANFFISEIKDQLNSGQEKGVLESPNFSPHCDYNVVWELDLG